MKIIQKNSKFWKLINQNINYNTDKLFHNTIKFGIIQIFKIIHPLNYFKNIKKLSKIKKISLKIFVINTNKNKIDALENQILKVKYNKKK